MKFVLKEDEDIKKLILKLLEAKRRGIRRIAEKDMLLSLLLFHLEEKSNYFSLCKGVGISPYGTTSKKLLINSIKEDFRGNVEKKMNYLKSRNKTNHFKKNELKEKKLYNSISALIKFMGIIKKDYIKESAYLEEEEKITLTKREEEKVSRILNILKEKKGKLYNLIENSLMLYYDALREKDSAFSFLRFWISVEILVKSGRKLSNEEILRRVSKIYNEELYGSLKLLYKKRNRVVHSYVFVSQDERNLMKSIAETIISFTLSKLKQIRTFEELRDEFENFNK